MIHEHVNDFSPYVLDVLVGVLGVLVGILVLFGILGVLFGVLGVLVRVLGVSLLIATEHEVLELPLDWLALLVEITHFVFQTELITATFRFHVALVLAPIKRF